MAFESGTADSPQSIQSTDDLSAVQVAEQAAPRAAYFHVPFCARRCGYCNFTLVANRADLIDSYLAAIERELGWLERPHEVDTLFFGGGTPTQLRGAQLERLLILTRKWHPPAPGHEFSVEANPADVDADMIRLLAQYGVTRISLGAQSFSAQKLRTLERDHSPDDIRRAVGLIREAGLNVALDMIFGVPGETPAAWQADLDAALALSPGHVSTYGLTFERGTTFWNRLSHGLMIQLGDEPQREMLTRAIDTLGAAGLEHYEVSNFARPGQRCRHNEVYWSGGSYFAVGPGASRYVNGVRETNHRSTTNYLKRVLAGRSPVAERERLEPEDRARELLVFGLRRMEGVARDWFAARSGYELDALVRRPLARHVALGMLADTGDRIRLTREGLFVSDAIWPDFLRC